MPHTIDCKRAIAPRWLARIRMDAPRLIGQSCAVAGSLTSRTFALRDGDAVSGNDQMRCRAVPAGGVP